MRRQEQIASVAIILYIVFFAINPPSIIRTILSTLVGMAAAASAAIYVTLYVSKVVGGLLLAALVLSMSRCATEGFDTSKGYFITTGSGSIYFTPAGTNDLYTVSSCTPCGTENVCISATAKTATEIAASSQKGAFTCSMLQSAAATTTQDVPPAVSTPAPVNTPPPPAPATTPPVSQSNNAAVVSALTNALVAVASPPVSPAPASAPVSTPLIESCALEPNENFVGSGSRMFAPF
jgi:hypothetical protein